MDAINFVALAAGMRRGRFSGFEKNAKTRSTGNGTHCSNSRWFGMERRLLIPAPWYDEAGTPWIDPCARVPNRLPVGRVRVGHNRGHRFGLLRADYVSGNDHLDAAI